MEEDTRRRESDEGREVVQALARPISDLHALDELLKRTASLVHTRSSQEEARRVAWLVEAQQTLVLTIAVDWQDALEAGSSRREQLLLDGCFFGDEGTAGASICATVASVSRLLTTRTQQLHTASRQLLEDVVRRLADSTKWSLSSVVEHLDRISTSSEAKPGQGAARAELAWKDFVAQACSLADRWSNLAQGGPEQDVLSRTSWIETTATQLEEAVARGSTASRLAVLLAKMIRVGYADDVFWTTIHARMAEKRIGNEEEPKYQSAWRNLLSKLPDSDNVTMLLEQLIDRLDAAFSAGLLSKDEEGRPGLEGARFLSSQAAEYSSLASHILAPLLIGPSGGDSDDDNDDDDDDGDERQGRWLTVALARQHVRSPLCACTLVLSLSPISITTLQGIADAWSAERRIRTATWEAEVYLTTLLVALLASSAAASSTTQQSMACQLSTRAAFIRGVSAHLEHPSPRVRRMGMLVAELVTLAAARGKETKPLSFGKGMWDGKGEGREEARVLRALYQSWPHRTTSLSDEDRRKLARSLFSLSKTATELVVVNPMKEVKPRQNPKTRQLPARIAPRRTRQSSLSDDDVETSLPSLTNVSGRSQMSFIQPLDKSSDEESSSSSSSSSSSLSSTAEDNTQGQDSKEEEQFGMGVPEKKKRRRPVYIHELAPLLREKDREANRLALRYVEVLVRRKAGWGAEIHEQAIDLTYALVALQDNFSLKNFEERRKKALVALVVASPHNVAPCLIEQYFHHQYSIAQRIAMLHALAFASRELAGLAVESKNGANTRALAEGLSQMAIAQARDRGHETIRGAESEMEKRLSLHSPQRRAGVSSMQVTQGTTAAATYTSIGPSLFIFPLITRFQLHLEDALARASRSSSSAGQMRRNRGGGAGSISNDNNLFSHMLVCPLLETLALLVDPTALSYTAHSDVAWAVLELCLFVSRWLRLGLGFDDDEEDGEGDGDGGKSMRASNAALCLVAIQGLSSLPASLRQQQQNRHQQLLAEVGQYASRSFEAAEQAGNDREAKCCAAVLLRLHEMRSG